MKPAITTPQPSPRSISEREWNFMNVPRSEQEMCTYYEYARNVPDYVDLVQQWRGFAAAQCDSEEAKLISFMQLGMMGYRLHNGYALFATYQPEWPEKSWQEQPRG